MIKYTLQCACSHVFEDWFASSGKYDELSAQGALTCPSCGGHDIQKTIMAPNVSTASAVAPSPCTPTGCANMGCPAMQG